LNFGKRIFFPPSIKPFCLHVVTIVISLLYAWRKIYVGTRNSVDSSHVMNGNIIYDCRFVGVPYSTLPPQQWRRKRAGDIRQWRWGRIRFSAFHQWNVGWEKKMIFHAADHSRRRRRTQHNAAADRIIVLDRVTWFIFTGRAFRRCIYIYIIYLYVHYCCISVDCTRKVRARKKHKRDH
jgi:hypothetical protein